MLDADDGTTGREIAESSERVVEQEPNEHASRNWQRQQNRQERRQPRGRGRQRGSNRERLQLSREEVVRAALAIVDREGLDGFSMRKLGHELGVDPMAAYYYFPNKAAVLDGIVDAVIAEAKPHLNPDSPWDDQLRTLARAQAAALRAHPNALPAIATHPPFTEASIQQIEAAAHILVGAGLRPWQALLAIEAIASFQIGTALAEVGLQPGGVPDPTEAEIRAYIARLPSDQYPVMAAALAEWVPTAKEDSFDGGMEILIAGIKARYADVLNPTGSGGF